MFDVLKSILTLWVMVAGAAMIVKGPQGLRAVVEWPLQKALGLLRKFAGDFLVWLGGKIKG